MLLYQHNQQWGRLSIADSVSNNDSHPQTTTISNGTLMLMWDEQVEVDNKPVKRIAAKMRNENGTSVGKTFLTTDSVVATYPVITSLQANKTMIAYIEKKLIKAL